MSAGPQYVSLRISRIRILTQQRRLNYTWINHDHKNVQLPAPTYIDYVMTWVQETLDNEDTFPTKSGLYTVLNVIFSASATLLILAYLQAASSRNRSPQP